MGGGRVNADSAISIGGAKMVLASLECGESMSRELVSVIA
jgi:hypothetical protein